MDSLRDGFEFAPCVGETDLMYDEEREAETKAICLGCTVVSECLDLGIREPDGVWGGKTPAERRTIIRKRNDHRTGAGRYGAK